MSVSATTAAKRRRAGNIVNTQLFKPTDAPIQNSIQRRTSQNEQIQSTQPATSMPPQPSFPQNTSINQQISSQQQNNNTDQNAGGQRPMSLQQVISVFDKRLLTVESHILNNKDTPPSAPAPTIIQSQEPKINVEQLKGEIENNLQSHFSEFDHRYQLLATEIMNLKHIMLKLQAYTLDVNKTLMDTHLEKTTEPADTMIKQPEDVLDLSKDLNDLKKEFHTTQENIVYDLEENNNVDKNLQTPSYDVTKEMIEDSLEDTESESLQQASETLEEAQEETMQQASEPIEDEEEKKEEIVQETMQETCEDIVEEKQDEIVEEAMQDTSENVEENQKQDEPIQETSKSVEENQKQDEPIQETSESVEENQKQDEPIQETSESVEEEKEDTIEVEKEIESHVEEKNEKGKRKRKNKKSIQVSI